MNLKVLIIDDDADLSGAISSYLQEHSLEVREASTSAAGLRVFEAFRPEVVLVDYMLPDGTALTLLPKLKELDPSGSVIVLTGYGTIDLAVRAVKQGADNFIAKPIQMAALLKILQKEVEGQRNGRKQAARRVEKARYERDPFLGSSPQIRRLAETMDRVVDSDSPILIQGETGTGKGVLANWVHRHGHRAEEAFVDMNCAGFSRELLESELFGHEKGAFTGAIAAKVGLFEVAHRGTVFLDEIGDLDLSIQPKLLKVLEDKRFRRLGAVQDRIVDVHLIAATHHSLENMVAQEKFRGDLYYRINTLTVRIPALRERSEDLPVIANRLLQQLRHDLGRQEICLSDAAMTRLQRYAWPGNIRELRNVLERAVLLCQTNTIEEQDIAFQTQSPLEHAPVTAIVEPRRETSSYSTLAQIEKEHIVAVLEHVHGKVPEAAKHLGIPRSSLYAKIRQYGLVR